MWTLVAALWACSTAAPPPLPEPWSALPAPALEAKINVEKSGDLHLVYEGRPREEILQAWIGALERGGWSLGEARRMGPMLVVDATQGARTLQVMVASKGQNADVLIYDKP